MRIHANKVALRVDRPAAMVSTGYHDGRAVVVSPGFAGFNLSGRPESHSEDGDGGGDCFHSVIFFGLH